MSAHPVGSHPTGGRSPLGPLVLLTDRRAHHRPLLRTVQESVDAGARTVLLRERDLPDDERRALAASLLPVLDAVGGSLLVAGTLPVPGAAGAHLAAREPLPQNRPGLLGRSCHDAAEVARAVEEGLDHVTVSPVALTASKPGHGPALGERGLRDLVAVARGVPVVALGGVDPGNAASWLRAGASAVAVMGAVMRAEDPGRVVEALLDGLPAHP